MQPKLKRHSYVTLLGFHPFEEIVFLNSTMTRGVAYDLKNSKAQDLGHMLPKHYDCIAGQHGHIWHLFHTRLVGWKIHYHHLNQQRLLRWKIHCQQPIQETILHNRTLETGKISFQRQAMSPTLRSSHYFHEAG